MKAIMKRLTGHAQLLLFLAHIGRGSTFPRTSSFQNTTEFEYIVVGSGPGGGPLAANLARNGHSVLLLEAGQDWGESDLQQVPFYADANSEDPTMSWEFFVSHYEDPIQAQRDPKFTWRTPSGELHVGFDGPPPENSKPLGILYPRTGTLGGCAQHNAMNAVLNPDKDWQHIADLTGDDEFSPEHIRELFMRLERNEWLSMNTSGHGFDGYVATNVNDIKLLRSQPRLMDIAHTAMIEAGQAGANATLEDVVQFLHTDQNRLDTGRYQQQRLFQLPVHIDGDRRRSGAYSYIRDTVAARNLDNSSMYPLTVRTNSLVTRILFDKNTLATRPRAVGVDYLEGTALYSADRRYNSSYAGIRRSVHATKEVIVSGGVFNTPQILMLSGIGPREHLESLDIPVIVNLPAVGKNVQDNYEGGFHVEAATSFGGPLSNCNLFQKGDPCLDQWRYNFSGPLGAGAAPIGMLMRSSYSENEDADLFFFGASGGAFVGHYPGFSTADYPPTTFFWSIVKMQSQNYAGTIKLRSTDPRDTPEIALNFFAEGREHDLSAISEGIDFARRILDNLDPNEGYGPFTYITPADGLSNQESILNEAFSHHATSSCKMGAKDDDNACVDSKFRVRGIDSLRVVDGSVFPRVPGGFPVLPTFLLSEKATDDILAAVAR